MRCVKENERGRKRIEWNRMAGKGAKRKKPIYHIEYPKRATFPMGEFRIQNTPMAPSKLRLSAHAAGDFTASAALVSDGCREARYGHSQVSHRSSRILPTPDVETLPHRIPQACDVSDGRIPDSKHPWRRRNCAYRPTPQAILQLRPP